MDGARRPPAPDAACRETRSGRIRAPPNWAKRPEIQFPHENIKSIPPGSNPSKRHRADRRIIEPSDQEPSRAVQPQASRAAVGRCEPRIGGNEHGQQRDEAQDRCGSCAPSSVSSQDPADRAGSGVPDRTDSARSLDRASAKHRPRKNGQNNSRRGGDRRPLRH